MMKVGFLRKILVVLGITISGSVQAYGDIAISDVVSVYDGDTIKVNIDHFPDIIGKGVSVRVRGIDTPEIRGKCQKEKDLAYKARNEAAKFLDFGWRIILENMDRDKYFRILADVSVDGKSLSQHLIKKNLAVPYFGKGKKFDWCS